MPDAPYWGPAQLHPSRLSRSVSAQEFNTDTVERCVRAGQSGKSDGRVRLGRQSATATLFCTGAPLPPPRSGAASDRVLAAPGCAFLAGLQTIHASSPATASVAVPGGGCGDAVASGAAVAAECFAFMSATSRSMRLPGHSCVEGSAGEALTAAAAAAAESKQHGGRSEAMDRRVRGGRLLRSQSKDPNFVSVLSLLDAMGPAGPQTPRSDTGTATTTTTATTTAFHPPSLPDEQRLSSGGGAGGGSYFCPTSSASVFANQPPPGHHHHQQAYGLSLGRLYSLDSATLHQLDRALSGASEHQLSLACGGIGGAGSTATSPVPVGPATASAPPQGALAAAAAASGGGGRIYKVRPLGAVASSVSLHSATCPLGSPFSRCNSTLLDFAEEQASLAAVQQSLGGGGAAAAAAAASLSGRVDYLAIVSSANNSLGGGGGGGEFLGGYGGSYRSSAAGSLSASPNPQQPHVSLAALLGAAAGAGANGQAASSGGGGSSSAGGGMAAAAAAVAAAGCSLPLRSSLPAEVGRQGGRTLAAPDMRFFPFSSPEDFYMAATVLLDAKLPGTLSGDSGTSPPGDGAPCE